MQQARAMVDIVKRYNWSYVSAIHTEGKTLHVSSAMLSLWNFCISHVSSLLCAVLEAVLCFSSQFPVKGVKEKKHTFMFWSANNMERDQLTHVPNFMSVCVCGSHYCTAEATIYLRHRHEIYMNLEVIIVILFSSSTKLPMQHLPWDFHSLGIRLLLCPLISIMI